MPVGLKARWPTREELIAWGMVPCREPGCRCLVNPELLRRHVCTRCALRWRKERKR